MAQQYFNSEQAAAFLGIRAAELIQMRERGEVRAFRDSGDWKFRKEDLEKLASQLKSRQAEEPESPDESSEDVLLSELALGESDSASSGTVIGSSEQASEQSDVKLAGSDVAIGAGAEEAKEQPPESKAEDLDEIDLTIDEDVPLEDSQIALADTGGRVQEGSPGSGVELGEELEDDELVLGGSGSGSDITIGQDSGISLVDPHDSGLSLDEPMELASDDESLALGEDEMLALSEEAEAPAELKADDDFLLTPMEEGAEEEDSESGSQVIALDTAGEAGDEAATMVAAGPAPMLDEDLAGMGAAIAEPAPLLEPAPEVVAPVGVEKPAAPGVPLAPGAVPLPEAPYGLGVMAGLSGCVVLLVLSGMMAFDLVRNMWSWDGAYGLSSSLMDMILGWF